MSKIKVFFTLTGYQITWLTCIFGELKFSKPNLGLYVGIIYLLIFFYYNKNKINFLKIAIPISLSGYLFDSIMVYFKIYEFNDQILLGTLPIWMITLWLSFSTLFDEILVFLKNYKILGLFLSLLGPLTYYLGVPIGIINISNLQLFITFMVIFWILLMLFYLEYILKKF
tara:strand:- start:927 stop:1436 length:510 start_codon:yes stop_codon:yes gene_type:complete